MSEQTSPVTPVEPATPVILEVQNPTAEEMAALMENVKVNYDFNVLVKPVAFNFKKSKDKLTGIETVRKPIELAVPYPSMEGIVAILEAGGKGLELLVEAMETVVNTAARDILSEDAHVGTENAINAANFPVEKLSWEFIANLPKAQRRGGGIPKETWEDFAKDYIEVMPSITGKTMDQVVAASKLLLAKLGPVRTNEPVLTLLQQQLALYVEHSPSVEDYAECVAFLSQKAETFLNTSPEELLANL